MTAMTDQRTHAHQQVTHNAERDDERGDERDDESG